MNLPWPKGGPRWYCKRPDLFKYLQEQMFKLAKEHGCQLELRDESHANSVEKTEGGFCVSVEPKDGDAYMISAPLVIGSSGGRTPVYQVCGIRHLRCTQSISAAADSMDTLFISITVLDGC